MITNNVLSDVHSENWGVQQTTDATSLNTFINGASLGSNQWDFPVGYIPAFGQPISPIITSPTTPAIVPTPVVPTTPTTSPELVTHSTPILQETESGFVTTTPTKTPTAVTPVDVQMPPVSGPVTTITKNVNPYVIGLGLLVGAVILAKILK